MLFSQTCVYGIQAMILIASKDSQQNNTTISISEELGISFHFLFKILKQLAHEGLVKSITGPNGGVKLAKAAKDITLYDIMIILDTQEKFTNCILELRNCGLDEKCPFHDKWSQIRNNFITLCIKSNLEVMASKVINDKIRLKK